MIFRRYGSFAGGIDLPDLKHRTLGRAVAPLTEMPPRLLLPLALCGTPASCEVSPGRDVRAGERLASAGQPGGVHVHAPVSGRVGSVVQAATADRDEFRTGPALELLDPGPPPELTAVDRERDYRDASEDQLDELLLEGGLSTFRRRPQPLGLWVRRARRAGCHLLIANAMEHEPYVTANHRLLAELGPEVVEGLSILARSIRAEGTMIAVDRRRTDDYADLADSARRHGVQRMALTHKYPSGADPMLAKVLARREVPVEGTMLDLGIASIDPATCHAVFRWVVGGLPPTARVVTVSGERAGRHENLWVPFGVPCEHLLDPTGTHVHGGPMTGLRYGRDAVVSCTTDALLALDADAPDPPGPCIRCGWCTDHCPARLNVAALNDAFEMGDVELADRLKTLACVHCGICTYVCPARLPLSQRTQELKRAIYTLKRSRRHGEAGETSR